MKDRGTHEKTNATTKSDFFFGFFPDFFPAEIPREIRSPISTGGAPVDHFPA
jgi:hypothetical protein